MVTIVEQYPDATFADDLLLDLEPPITWPVAPVSLFRFGKTINGSLTNRAGGPAGLMSTNNQYTLTEQSMRVATGTGAYVPVAVPLPCTLLVVFKQEAAATNQTLGGAPNTSLPDNAGIIVGATGVLGAFARNSSTSFNATLPKDGGDRWEMLVATYNNSGGAGAGVISLHRPRTNSKTTISNSTLPAAVNSSAVLRILGAGTLPFNAAVEGGMFAHWSQVLTDQQIADAYSSVKSSIASSGISI